MRALIILLPLAACGFPHGPVVTSCTVEGWGPVTSSVEISCETVQRRFGLARIAHLGFNEPQGLYEGIPVHIEDTWCLESKDNGDGSIDCTEGETTEGGIRVTRDLSALAHEMFHVLDANRLNIGSSWHMNWEPWGYFAAAKPYEDIVWHEVKTERGIE